MRENHPDQFEKIIKENNVVEKKIEVPVEIIYSGGTHDQNQIYHEEPLPGDQHELIEFRLVNKPNHLNCFVNSVI